jgi:RimK family alpha-L-glutamate ligase
MQIAVLAQTDSWYAADLIRAAGTEHRIRVLSFARLAAVLDGCDQWSITVDGQRLNDFDAVIVRTMPPGSLEQVVFRMDALGRLQADGMTVVNPPRALEAAVDKYLASALLQSHGVPTVPTAVCQTVDDAMEAFEQFQGDVVVKPIFGSEGRGILRVSDPSLALRVFRALTQVEAVCYIQPFLDHHGFDLRLVVLGQRVFGIRRRNPDDWRTNVSRGATPEPMDLDPALEDLARRATRAVGAVVAGVDVLPAGNGNQYVLEVNAVPGWRALSRALGIDFAAELLAFVAGCAGERSSTDPPPETKL